MYVSAEKLSTRQRVVRSRWPLLFRSPCTLVSNQRLPRTSPGGCSNRMGRRFSDNYLLTAATGLYNGPVTRSSELFTCYVGNQSEHSTTASSVLDQRVRHGKRMIKAEHPHPEKYSSII